MTCWILAALVPAAFWNASLAFRASLTACAHSSERNLTATALSSLVGCAREYMAPACSVVGLEEGGLRSVLYVGQEPDAALFPVDDDGVDGRVFGEEEHLRVVEPEYGGDVRVDHSAVSQDNDVATRMVVHYPLDGRDDPSS